MNIDKSKFYDDSKGRYELNSKESVFVCFMFKDKYVALFLDATDSIEDYFKFVGETHTLKNVPIKIIGSSKLNRQVKAISEKFGLVIDKLITRTEYKVVLLPKQKKVLLEKSIITSVTPKKGKTKILIVDDSKSIRLVLRKAFSTYPDLEVVGELEDPRTIMKTIDELKPDVITLDLQMPFMNGIEALKTYIPKKPIPTIVVSALSMNEGPMVLDALSAGAVDYVQKPDFENIAKFQEIAVEKIREINTVRVRRSIRRTQPNLKLNFKPYQDSHIIAIGASTGGTEALKDILTQLPPEIPPIVVVQHIPAVFSKALAERLNSICPFEVVEATDGMDLQKNRVIIAPGGMQMKVMRRSGGHYYVNVVDEPPVNRHKPSVDYMFESVAQNVEKSVIGVMLTGMGADGAKSMLKMKNKGAINIAQDEESSVVFGMPAAAIKVGAVDKVSPLLEIPEAIYEVISKKKMKKAS